MSAARDTTLTREERRLRWLLYANGAIAAAFIVQYLAEGIFDGEGFRFVVNSVGKDVLFLALCLLAAADVRRHGWLSLLVALGYGALITTQAVMLIVGGQEPVRIFGTEIGATAFLLSWMALRHRARRLARALVDGGRAGAPRAPVPQPDRLQHARGDGRRARRTASARCCPPRRWRATSTATSRASTPAASATCSSRSRRWPSSRCCRSGSRSRRCRRPRGSSTSSASSSPDVTRRRGLRFLRPYLRASIRVASQMSYLGYYGDERTWASVGYVPFSKRPKGRKPPCRGPHRPAAEEPAAAAANGRPYDAIVIGSGAGGAIAAYHLAAADKRVLVLERGPHVDPADFSEDEIRQYLLLYNEGALQLATDFRLQVLQGMCVGGGTTINNGVCLPPPAAVLDALGRARDRPRGARGRDRAREGVAAGAADRRQGDQQGAASLRGRRARSSACPAG